MALGGVFLLLALAGFVLPVLQGWFFFALAVTVLSQDIKWFKKMESKVLARFPRIARLMERVRRAVPLWDE